MVNWKGVYPALTTKFDAKGDLDLDQFEINLNAQIEAGIDGIILGGSLGEASTLLLEEKMELLHKAKSITKEIPVIINVAESSLKRAIQVAQTAEENGADGLMALPPMMYKSTDRETANWFTNIANSTDLPIMIYNNPVDYKIEVTLAIMEQLLKLPNIKAIKESTRDVSNISRLKSTFGDNLKVSCGVDTLALESLLMGADGWVAGLVCAFPRETVAIYRLALAGKIDQAVAIHRWFLPILELDINPQLVQNIKLAEVMTGIGTEHVRAPRMPLEGKERERVINILETGLATRPQLPDYLHLGTAKA
ncbi:MAG: dihydrodipicolinate synthase family protein [Saprospiraceae bacterium]